MSLKNYSVKTFYVLILTVTLNHFLFGIEHIRKDEPGERALRLFESRGDINKLIECTKVLDSLLGKKQEVENLLLAARAYYLLADYNDPVEKKLEYYDKGYKYGERALNLITSYSTIMKEKTNEEEAINSITKENIQSLYWTASNLARWAKFTSFINKIKVKSKVRMLWDKVLELEPGYFYGGVYRFFGGYYALVPTITGEQDPAKSKEMFEKAIQEAPDYLDSKVLYAEIYCTHAKIKDKELFEKLLNEVLTADISAKPEIIPENTLAIEKAKKLLAQEKELFE